MKTLMLLTLVACSALADDRYTDNVTYDSHTNLDGSITTSGSDGSDYVARPTLDGGYLIEGRRADGARVSGITRNQIDGSTVTTIQK